MVENPSQYGVIMVGLGGKGVLTVGEILAQAAMVSYRHILWFPSYSTMMRGGSSQCTVILSHTPITCPIVEEAEALIVIESSQLRLFQDRVLPQGLIVVESAGLSDKVSREDVRVLEVPGVEIALRLGGTQAANFVLLGAYIGATGVLPPEVVQKELTNKFASRDQQKALNVEAFWEGVGLGISAKQAISGETVG